MQGFYNFLNSKAGLMILGFLATTSSGAIISYLVQTKMAENERNFDIYQERYKEQKQLQKDLLQASNTRAFTLRQVLDRAIDSDKTVGTAKNFWLENYAEVKDQWNKELIDYHSMARVLFSEEVSDLLLYGDENRPERFNNVEENLKFSLQESYQPKSLHGAFIAAHATAYHLVFKCAESDKCENWDDMVELAKTQLDLVELKQSCLSYSIAGEMLSAPYNLEENFRLPDRCL